MSEIKAKVVARPEAEAAIQAHSLKARDEVGWGAVITPLGGGGQRVEVSSADGFYYSFVVLASESLDWEQLLQSCMYDTIGEIRRRRHAK